MGLGWDIGSRSTGHVRCRSHFFIDVYVFEAVKYNIKDCVQTLRSSFESLHEQNSANRTLFANRLLFHYLSHHFDFFFENLFSWIVFGSVVFTYFILTTRNKASNLCDVITEASRQSLGFLFFQYFPIVTYWNSVDSFARKMIHAPRTLSTKFTTRKKKKLIEHWANDGKWRMKKKKTRTTNKTFT